MKVDKVRETQWHAQRNSAGTTISFIWRSIDLCICDHINYWWNEEWGGKRTFSVFKLSQDLIIFNILGQLLFMHSLLWYWKSLSCSLYSLIFSTSREVERLFSCCSLLELLLVDDYLWPLCNRGLYLLLEQDHCYFWMYGRLDCIFDILPIR